MFRKGTLALILFFHTSRTTKMVLSQSFSFTVDNVTVQFCSVQSLSHVWLFVTPWTAAHQASLSITNSWSLLKLMLFKSVMPSNHLFSHPLLFLPSIFPSVSFFPQWVSSLHQVAKVLELQLQHQSFQCPSACFSISQPMLRLTSLDTPRILSRVCLGKSALEFQVVSVCPRKIRHN